jgi:hypothetical protein
MLWPSFKGIAAQHLLPWCSICMFWSVDSRMHVQSQDDDSPRSFCQISEGVTAGAVREVHVFSNVVKSIVSVRLEIGGTPKHAHQIFSWYNQQQFIQASNENSSRIRTEYVLGVLCGR